MGMPEGPILIGCHHQCGTASLIRLAQAMSAALDLPLVMESRLYPEVGIILDTHSNFDFDLLPTGVRGLHMVRDPRDLALSCWLHHLHSNHAWLDVPREQVGGIGLKPFLKSQPIANGLRAELQFLREHDIRDMLTWNYERPGIIELSFEQLWEDRVGLIAGALHGLGFSGMHYEKAAGAVLSSLCAESELEGNDDERWAYIGMWRWAYGPQMKKDYDEIIGNAHESLGYEAWGDSSNVAS